MKLKAISNGDTVLIMKDPQHCIGPNRPVAAFHGNTMEVHSGCSEYLEEALSALREYKKERNLPAAPVKVEYW